MVKAKADKRQNDLYSLALKLTKEHHELKNVREKTN